MDCVGICSKTTKLAVIAKGKLEKTPSSDARKEVSPNYSPIIPRTLGV